MENYNTQVKNEALDWDAEIEDTAPEYVTVPEGEYQFTVTGMERGHFPGSKKIGPCNKATLTIKVDVPNGLCTFRTDILLTSILKWKIVQFFRSINMLAEGGKMITDWDHVVGKVGRAKIKVRNYTTQDGEERSVNDIDTFLPYDETKIKDKDGLVTLNPDDDLPF